MIWRITRMMTCLVVMFFIGCTKKYKFTAKTSNKSLFVEVYEVNPFGMDADFLTDSLTFKKYIGDWDEEHEDYIYDFKGDSICIMKITRGNRWAEWDTSATGVVSLKYNIDTTDKRVLYLSELKKLKNFR